MSHSVIILAFLLVYAIEVITFENDLSCTNKASCSSCLQSTDCAWCSDPRMDNLETRCFKPALMSHNCSERFIINPENEQIMWKNLYSLPIKPQHVSLKIRADNKETVRVGFKPIEEDFPLDLYFLIDLTMNESNDWEKLSEFHDLLLYRMRNTIYNLRIGFGSFANNARMHYDCDDCKTSYALKNHMSLSSEIKSFSENVFYNQKYLITSSNTSYSGLDALLQAVVCKQEIGWRANARRVIVFATNTEIKVASDENIPPNDGLCHTKNGIFTQSTVQDHPSISQLNSKVNENAINIIFAVPESRQKFYRELTRQIDGASSGVLAEDSSNVVELVMNEYNKITTSVIMKDTASDIIKISYSSKCLGNFLKKTNKCHGLRNDDSVTFEVEISFTSCPADPKDFKQNFQIYPVGVGESLTMEVDMICACDCESGGLGSEKNSLNCNKHGDLVCGACKCNDGFSGKKCELDLELDDNIIINNENCRKDNTTDLLCSGRGRCESNQCICAIRENPDEQIYGKYCECDNFSCIRNYHSICSGPDRGRCECGECLCNDGFTGPACECTTSTISCQASNGEICSGNGRCECGRCVCDYGDYIRYSGRFCENAY